MVLNLSKLPLEELLRKFATGGHKPGSGSAAALLGLISCALIKTVIGLSKKRKAYEKVRPKLDSINASIADDVEPALLAAFDGDSEQFDKVITARRGRDLERDPIQRWKHARQALKELHSATGIALIIAEKCLLVAEHAITVFDIGFKSARGDSMVAIDSALSGTTSAISIAYLNLRSHSGNTRAIEQLRHAQQLENRAERVKEDLQTRGLKLKSAAEHSNCRFALDLNRIRNPELTESRYDESDIEAIAKNLQNELWISRREIWTDGGTLGHIGILDIPTAFRVLEYKFETATTLGQFSDGVEAAGYINKQEKYAAVSKRFEPVVQRFTAAHELGHAVLHKANEQFRERALDGSAIQQSRPQVEYEADKFAVNFLMPESLMREVFSGLYGYEQYVVSDRMAFALGAKNCAQLMRECPTLRDLSLRLAKTDIFDGRAVNSIANIFGVSCGAMAIRIEELQMIDLSGHPFNRRES